MVAYTDKPDAPAPITEPALAALLGEFSETARDLAILAELASLGTIAVPAGLPEHRRNVVRTIDAICAELRGFRDDPAQLNLWGNDARH